jgi:hypothetical protein
VPEFCEAMLQDYKSLNSTCISFTSAILRAKYPEIVNERMSQRSIFPVNEIDPLIVIKDIFKIKKTEWENS